MPRARVRLLLAVAVSLGLVITALPIISAVGTDAAAPPASPSPTPAQGPRADLGVQYHGLWAEWDDARRTQVLDTLAANGVKRIRLDMSWAMIEPHRRGSYDMDWGVPFIDKTLAMTSARGMKVLVTFWLTPAWANNGRGDRALPDDPDDYADALAWSVRRWGDRVEAWEVWNEPNSRNFLAEADPRGYANLLSAAYRAAKAVSRNTVVVFGGTKYVDTSWIARAYELGAKDHFDVMAVHPYQGLANLPPEAGDDGTRYRLSHTRSLIELMRRKGDGSIPVWFTEFGWSAHANPPDTPPWALGIRERDQAAYLLRTMRYVQDNLPQVKRAYWYTAWDTRLGRVHQDNYGLIRRDGSTRPVLKAAACYIEGDC